MMTGTLPVLQLLPPAFPSGWYVVAQSRELTPGAVLTRRFVGQDLVLFRGEEGRATAIDPYCPHLGAHFGQGGRVEGELLRCAMHGFRFNNEGDCVSTPTGCRPPQKARGYVWPLREQNGLLLVFHHPQRVVPDWEVPVLDERALTPPLWKTLAFRGHPQETSENSADLLHFAAVHNYEDVRLAATESEGAELRTKMTFRRRNFLGSGSIPIEIAVHVHGLGFSYVDALVPALGLKTRQFVLSTPTEADRVELRVGMAIGTDVQLSKVHPLLTVLPRSLVFWLISRVSMSRYVQDVRQDVPMWENKSYLHQPALSADDGPIARYRKWARQFYPALHGVPSVRDESPAPELSPTVENA